MPAAFSVFAAASARRRAGRTDCAEAARDAGGVAIFRRQADSRVSSDTAMINDRRDDRNHGFARHDRNPGGRRMSPG
jgi:hypothetical protein